ncbi:MAG: ribosome biogenesis GTPase YqeH [Thermosipho sp. (in: Bacteria)]|nr:ribosome biogenesis GTPase YqeH [Thermosipho sp. (in: thermotogales)]
MKCYGCGVELQTIDPKKPGYIPEHVLETTEEPLCQRCFRIKHYGKLSIPIEEELFLHKIDKILKDFNKVLYVIDIIDFEGTYRKEIMDSLKEKEVYFAVTKFDLMPRSLSSVEAQEWLKEMLNTDSSHIFLTSSRNGFGLKKLEKFLKSLKEDILVIGITNVGKSSLISKFTNTSPTISPFPGTTLGLLKRKIKNSKYHLVDTPGILTNDRIIDLLTPECQAKILNTNQLSRKTYKITQDRAILIGAFCKIEIEFEAEFLPIFQIFAPKNVKFHETKKEKADDLMIQRAGDLLIPPCEKAEMKDIEWKEERYDLTEEKELVIFGLAFINVKRGPFKIMVKVPKNIKVVVRNRLLKPKRGGKKHES